MHLHTFKVIAVLCHKDKDKKILQHASLDLLSSEMLKTFFCLLLSSVIARGGGGVGKGKYGLSISLPCSPCLPHPHLPDPVHCRPRVLKGVSSYLCPLIHLHLCKYLCWLWGRDFGSVQMCNTSKYLSITKTAHATHHMLIQMDPHNLFQGSSSCGIAARRLPLKIKEAQRF